ncbi:MULTISPECIES: HAD-IIIC family phosphatase [unclassified Campylobacter]|uniref:HAD-IIIC family phosphatase n=1 Tax=unclassified Campylobacter TaxID=2593542 RepID=UPI0012381137|nr:MULTISPECIES: HAD-IIIC family phosphatase [unclassified Campylobacter]KAA6224943.1 HAD-IIIC family phosphatase [Campylobacter sp. LR286c]KAA6228392.1 HAD-IIIC family phosphatase [Campylobacter sp. LR185c]KAA6228879.1 HAD-IIIC family phosphatase [Campylobacter sp. LR196d]KAA6234044.1 HAD-IIIC family phosphatase [Campylobacter sp. LR291e]KAA8603759.1 capsular biosynthesis protein [Campylobacter sp. LR185c]
MKNLLIDLDNTLTIDEKEVSYENKRVNLKLANKLVEYKKMGFKIIIFTSRNMKSFNGNIKKIRESTLPLIIEWLEKNNIIYDEIIVGKPWCGEEGFYVDDKAIRPSEFENLNYDEICKLLDIKKDKN